MTTCEAVHTAIHSYGHTPREALPSWLRHPITEEEFNLSIAVLGLSTGIAPICEDGILVAWSGIGVKV